MPFMGGLCVVIVNYNGGQWNMPCLHSLLVQGKVLQKVIFVDNASTDGSLQAVQKQYGSDDRFEFIALSHNTLFAAGCNRGMERALGFGAEYIFLLNNDTIIEPRALNRLCQFLTDKPDASGVQPLLVRMDDPEIIASAGCCISRMGGAWDHSMGLPVGSLSITHFEVAGITGGAALWRASVLRQTGLLDERFGMYFEDVDLSLRVRKAGGHVFTLPQAKVRHMVSASTNQAPSGFCVRYCQTNALRLLLKHWPSQWFWSDCFCWLFISTAACLSNIWHRRWKNAIAIGAGILVGLRCFYRGLAERRQRDMAENDVLKPWISREYWVPPSSLSDN